MQKTRVSLFQFYWQNRQVERTVRPEGDRKKTSPALLTFYQTTLGCFVTLTYALPTELAV